MAETIKNGAVHEVRTSSVEKELSRDVEMRGVESETEGHQHGKTNYQTMAWWHLTLLLLAETISLGILGLSFAIARLGLVPGVLTIAAFGILSTYTGKIYGDFKNRYPAVMDIVGAGELLFGRPGRWLFEMGSNLVLIFIMAAHVVSFAIMMKALLPESQRSCGVYWLGVGAAVQLVLTLPRKMKAASYISALSSVSVLIAVIIVMADVGSKAREVGLPPDVDKFGKAGFTTTTVAVLCIVTSYTGHVAYLSLASELVNYKDFKKALYTQMSVATVLYTLVGFVIYWFVGSSVTSPALSSASPGAKRIAYGVASFTIVIAGVVNGHVLCKYYYHRFFEKIMEEKSVRSWGAWIGLVIVSWIISFVLAGLIPSFHLMLALVSALFSAWFSFGVPAWMWFHLQGVELSRANWRSLFNRRPVSLAVLAAAIFFMSTVLSIVGLYATIKDIEKIKDVRPFSCNVDAASDE